ncbi:MAG: DUF2141 domain-containing protein [Chitinophagaceae bacterium]
MHFGKRILFSLSIMVFLTLKANSQEVKHTINITNLQNVKGNLYIGWYKEANTFRINDKAIYREKVVVNNQKEVNVVFKNIPKGKYAIAVFVDENDNYKLDKNVFGIPKEKYGFSNNVLPSLRPATFDESVFELYDKEALITIKLK